MKIGQRVKVFDADEWTEKRDCTHPNCNNACYYKSATIINLRKSIRYNEPIADVRFDYKPDKISYGHFTSEMKEIK